MCRNKDYHGSVKLGQVELSEASEQELMKRMTLISHNSYLFKGSLRDNLIMGKEEAADDELWQVLEKVKLKEFVKASDSGLDMELSEGGSNLSGGQRQRLALARAILHDSPVYIFDEATSNIDVESENDLMKLIISMTEDRQNKKTIILISHRLANVTRADNIYVMKKGKLVQSGKHEFLIREEGIYKKLWDEQQALEDLYKEGA